jgi:hypothetical protein
MRYITVLTGYKLDGDHLPDVLKYTNKPTYSCVHYEKNLEEYRDKYYIYCPICAMKLHEGSICNTSISENFRYINSKECLLSKNPTEDDLLICQFLYVCLPNCFAQLPLQTGAYTDKGIGHVLRDINGKKDKLIALLLKYDIKYDPKSFNVYVFEM